MYFPVALLTYRHQVVHLKAPLLEEFTVSYVVDVQPIVTSAQAAFVSVAVQRLYPGFLPLVRAKKRTGFGTFTAFTATLFHFTSILVLDHSTVSIHPKYEFVTEHSR